MDLIAHICTTFSQIFVGLLFFPLDISWILVRLSFLFSLGHFMDGSHCSCYVYNLRSELLFYFTRPFYFNLVIPLYEQLVSYERLPGPRFSFKYIVIVVHQVKYPLRFGHKYRQGYMWLQKIQETRSVQSAMKNIRKKMV